MNFARYGSTLCLLLSTFAFGCGSSSSPPAPATDSQSLRADCYPSTGEYTVHYTRTSGDPKVCEDLADNTETIEAWDGIMPEMPGCKLVADNASCGIVSRCEDAKDGVASNMTTTMKFAKNAVSGSVTLVVSGSAQANCTYDFTYTKP